MISACNLAAGGSRLRWASSHSWPFSQSCWRFNSRSTRVWESNAHPLYKMISDEFSPGVAQLAFLMAVIVAPVFEELLFRGILQSWLVSLGTRRGHESAKVAALSADTAEDAEFMPSAVWNAPRLTDMGHTTSTPHAKTFSKRLPKPVHVGPGRDCRDVAHLCRHAYSPMACTDRPLRPFHGHRLRLSQNWEPARGDLHPCSVQWFQHIAAFRVSSDAPVCQWCQNRCEARSCCGSLYGPLGKCMDDG